MQEPPLPMRRVSRTIHDRFAVWVPRFASGNCEIQKLSRWAVTERRKHTYRYRLLQDGEVIASFETREQMVEALRDLRVPIRSENQEHAGTLLRQLEIETTSDDDSSASSSSGRGYARSTASDPTGRRRVQSHNPSAAVRGVTEVRAPRSQDIRAPRGPEVRAPRAPEVRAPRSQEVQAPRPDFSSPATVRTPSETTPSSVPEPGVRRHSLGLMRYLGLSGSRSHSAASRLPSAHSPPPASRSNSKGLSPQSPFSPQKRTTPSPGGAPSPAPAPKQQTAPPSPPLYQPHANPTAPISTPGSPPGSGSSPRWPRVISPSVPTPIPIAAPFSPQERISRRNSERGQMSLMGDNLERGGSPAGSTDQRSLDRISSVETDRTAPSEPRIAKEGPKDSPSPVRRVPTALLSPADKPTELVTAWYYDDPSGSWRAEDLIIRIAAEPFAKGAMREAFHMVLCRPDGTTQALVAKRFRKPAESEVIKLRDAEFGGHPHDTPVEKRWAQAIVNKRGSPFERQVVSRCLSEHMVFELKDFLMWFHRLRLFRIDCEMQGFCRTYAAAFNKCTPPKPVTFLEAFMVVFAGRPNAPVFACETLIEGKYVKHNNNAGEVPERRVERNTPQAFSHFTYIHSNRQYVIIDIQGVGDTYTDPQVHSADQKGFGLGNLGQKGIDAFLQTHRCNNICIGLGLAPLEHRVDVSGTSYHAMATDDDPSLPPPPPFGRTPRSPPPP